MRIPAALLVLIIAGPLRAGPVETMERHEGPVTALAFSPNGDRLLSVAEDGRAQVWDVGALKVFYSCLQKDEKLFAAAWRSDGRCFATAGESGVVRVWKLGDEKPTAEYRGHKGPVLALAFSPDGKILASGGYMRTIRLWPGGEGNGLNIKDMDGRVTSLAFTDDGKELVVGTAELTEQRINGDVSNRYGEGGFILVYNVRSRELTRILSVRGSQVAVAGDRVLAVGIVASWEVRKEKGERLLYTDGGPVLSIADLKTGKKIATAAGAGMPAAWSKDGKVVVCGGQCYRHYPGNIMLRSEEDKPGGVAFVKTIDKGDWITTLAIDPRERESNNIIVGQWLPPALRDPITLKKGAVLDQERFESLAVSPDGKLIAVGEPNGMIRLHRTPESK